MSFDLMRGLQRPLCDTTLKQHQQVKKNLRSLSQHLALLCDYFLKFNRVK